jgi:hypothetical protein
VQRLWQVEVHETGPPATESLTDELMSAMGGSGH